MYRLPPFDSLWPVFVYDRLGRVKPLLEDSDLRQLLGAPAWGLGEDGRWWT